ncbi:MAG: glycosyltransferase family 2 protein [Chloroflexi bacterium]|nr:glycosyltransferase family 2 protein [Chloroflexota bacterium]
MVAIDLSIVIPCYNEAGNVAQLHHDLLPTLRELSVGRSIQVVFVDDGSTDATWQRLHEAFALLGDPSPATVQFERHGVNRGLGAALRTGFRAAAGNVVVTTDSDGTYRFSTIPALLTHLRPEIDIVTASPYHPQGGVAGVPAYRLLFSRGASALYRLLVRGDVHTYTALYRAYRRSVIDAVTFQSDGFLAVTEVLARALLMGFTVAEYPAVLQVRTWGASKAKVLRITLAHLRFLGRILLHRARVRPMVHLQRVA